MNAWKFHEGQAIRKVDESSGEEKFGVVTNIGKRFVLVQYEGQESSSRTVENPRHLEPVK